MKREEAIHELQEDKRLYETDVCHAGDGSPDGRLLEALDMAIEALQREEAEEKGYCHRIKPKEYLKNDAIKPSNDVINRADAIKAVAEHFSFDDGCSNIYKDIDYYKGIAEHILKNVPSAKQVTSKLKNHCDSLLTEESNGSKEQKSKLDLISRADAIKAVAKLQKYDLDERNRLRIYAPWHKPKRIFVETEAIYKTIYALPSADAVSREAHYDAVANRITDMEERGFVSVVRCKDCKYSFYDKDYESYNCRKHEYVELFDADDYCSWGERND